MTAARRHPQLVVEPESTACRAPSVQLFFRPDGQVRPCCVHSLPFGNVASERLGDIWAGPVRQATIDRLAHGDMSRGCGDCGAEVALEGRTGSYPARFDRWSVGPETRWPSVLDFNLSIECNLQCIQCDGDKSSSIRIHRERRSPLPEVYDDTFYVDLEPFIAHAELAMFSGGEPFMGRPNFRVWDMIPSLNPDLVCRVITNATHWNRRVEAALAAVPLGFVFSIDGATAATYESIRIGADFATVVENVDRFIAYARDRGTDVSINHCLMAQNVHEFAEMLLFAEERGLHVDVSVVRQPAHCSIARMPDDRLRAVAADLQARSASVLPRLPINAATWEREVARIDAWADLDAEARRPLWSQHLDAVAGLPRQGAGPFDDAAVRTALADLPGDDPTVHWLDIDAGGVVVACSPSLRTLGVDVDAVVGRPANDPAGIQSRIRDVREVTRTDDRVDGTGCWADRAATFAIVALRDGSGWADHARVLLRVGPTSTVADR